ncbi:hypothetical protein L249_7574 [Ophiocordyceps polyrhachis-furcata BCC 54312]|uniref:Uncharacterized protein n=1 Tax=Ophiocordyceps polyrhachis-furcata BCC 54312 TaxID=1330021 RepID=A0A367LBT0_9HYPO|nr:hypothetical protein L249_7574 [Ophiocordyceps polyrhachis-furcata BCC 54312]
MAPNRLRHLLILAITSLTAEAIAPSIESARANSHRIFNAVNHAGRQWGSALNHNGFSFFSAVVPAGTLLYRGSPDDEFPPEGVEWLAFELEHAQQFATPKDEFHADDGRQKPLLRRRRRRGYIQTYQATRDIPLLYADGMSAAKTSFGTLDSQDLILRDNKTADAASMAEQGRAADICRLIQPWGYAGLVRMEAGFEVVYCDFANGIRLLSAVRMHLAEDKVGDDALRTPLWVRAVTERYDGLGVDRLSIDFSSMLSAFFFPINVSGTDPSRPDLVRLAATPLHQLRDIKTRLEHVASQPRRFTVDWQAVTDMVVRRFANRLAHMAADGDGISDMAFIDELESAVLLYIDGPSNATSIAAPTGDETTKLCTQHLLLSSTLSQPQWTESDRLIHAAIEAVLHDTCTTLLSVFTSLVEASSKDITGAAQPNRHLSTAVAAGRRDVKHLVQRLSWSEWRKVRRCPVGEVMFSVMWPLGNQEDYWQPGCRRLEDLGFERQGYWGTEDGPLRRVELANQAPDRQALIALDHGRRLVGRRFRRSDPKLVDAPAQVEAG